MPYRGSLPALNDLVAGHIPMMFCDIGPAAGLLQAKRVRPLGISTKTRHPNYPDIPPLNEAGVPGFDAVSWQMMVAPAKTPRPIVDRLHAELTAVLAHAGRARSRSCSMGFLPLQDRSVEELQAFVKSEIVRWGKVVRTPESQDRNSGLCQRRGADHGVMLKRCVLLACRLIAISSCRRRRRIIRRTASPSWCRSRRAAAPI